MQNNSTINGDLVFKAGPRKSLFSALIVSGKVSQQFLDVPEVAPVKGMTHSILGGGQWFAKETAGKTSWQRLTN